MATVVAAARGAGARAAAGLRGGGGAVARGRPRAGCARRLCTAPAAPATVDMKRYLWERYHEAKRSTDGECAPQPQPSTRGPPPSPPSPCTLPLSRAWLPRRRRAQNLATLASLFPAVGAGGRAVSYLGVVKPGACIGKCSGPSRGFQGRESEDVTPTPLGVVIHPGNDSSSPAAPS